MARTATARKATDKRGSDRAAPSGVGWQPAGAVVRDLLLKAILDDNPIPLAYRLNYLANFYVGPLVAMMERSHRLTRSEWIVLFCLMRQPRLNAQQISLITGRPKTSIARGISLLQRKKLITRRTDVADSRRRVIHLTEAGQKIYRTIIDRFIARESAMLTNLTLTDRRELQRLFDKLISGAPSWARPY